MTGATGPSMTGATGPSMTGPTGPSMTGPTGPIGLTGPSGISSSIFSLGNVAIVDIINGNNATASVGGSAFSTIESAIIAISPGQTIWVLPGTYNLSTGIIIPDGTSLRGLSVQTVKIQMLNVTTNTTLITMGNNSRLEDVTLLLTSSGHHTLKGIVFGGTSSIDAKMRQSVITVNNSTSSSVGSSDVIGVECNGTGVLGPSSFSFNSLKSSTINVYSNGGGNKRGILVSTSNVVTTRDMNIYVSQPTLQTSTGSYVGVETADSLNIGSIQMRATTIGTVSPTIGQLYTASDILQTNPAIITNPTYLSSAGIQLGPGTDLINKTAGGKGFSTYTYLTNLYYGLRGEIKNSTNGAWLWPGTQVISLGVFPDPSTPSAFYRVQQPCVLCGMCTSINNVPGNGNSITITIQKLIAADVPSGIPVNTIYTVTFGGADLSKTFYSGSVNFNSGDRLLVYMTYTGNNSNTAHDLTCQLDIF